MENWREFTRLCEITGLDNQVAFTMDAPAVSSATTGKEKAKHLPSLAAATGLSELGHLIVNKASEFMNTSGFKSFSKWWNATVGQEGIMLLPSLPRSGEKEDVEKALKEFVIYVLFMTVGIKILQVGWFIIKPLVMPLIKLLKWVFQASKIAKAIAAFGAIYGFSYLFKGIKNHFVKVYKENPDSVTMDDLKTLVADGAEVVLKDYKLKQCPNGVWTAPDATCSP